MSLLIGMAVAWLGVLVIPAVFVFLTRKDRGRERGRASEIRPDMKHVKVIRAALEGYPMIRNLRMDTLMQEYFIQTDRSSRSELPRYQNRITNPISKAINNSDGHLSIETGQGVFSDRLRMQLDQFSHVMIHPAFDVDKWYLDINRCQHQFQIKEGNGMVIGVIDGRVYTYDSHKDKTTLNFDLDAGPGDVLVIPPLSESQCEIMISPDSVIIRGHLTATRCCS